VLRSVHCASVAATVAALVLPGPATGVERSAPVDGLTVHPEWGSVTGQGGFLQRGCRSYAYTYAISPPPGIWALEVFIRGPRLHSVAGGAFIDGYDPTSGTGHYTLCRNSTRHGRFTIWAKLSVDDGSGHVTQGALPLDQFRLRRTHR